jgi:hypothetical protein
MTQATTVRGAHRPFTHPGTVTPVTTEQPPTEQPAPRARTARIVVEVLAGLMPGGTPDPDFTRRYVITDQEWATAKQDPTGVALGVLLAETNGRAAGYAGMLMLQPDRLNWVRTDWIYL